MSQLEDYTERYIRLLDERESAAERRDAAHLALVQAQREYDGATEDLRALDSTIEDHVEGNLLIALVNAHEKQACSDAAND